jgi:hypothetical protein
LKIQNRAGDRPYASLVGLSTLYTKQHYILDVLAGTLLAFLADLAFLRGYPRKDVPDLDRRLAPFLAMTILGVIAVGFACFWVAYRRSRG